MKKQFIIAAAVLSAGVATQAADIDVTDNVTNSVTWTSNNTYHLMNQIYVEPGATLTIAAGTVIKSGSSGVEGGSLAVCRGAKIYVNGTKDAPVIMTAWDDPMTSWKEGCNEWGNLTIMGKGLISASHFKNNPVGTNTKEPTGLNENQMEGLAPDASHTYLAMYGGADDNDDSGSLSYLSIRYGGKAIGLGNELNGLSMGAIGRETDVSHIDIMNNVDDGIETWGGAVNYKYISIWNIGDDSFDFDEGWRGKAQFGLLCQGYSVDAAQGSGVGDNCFEFDGAEQSDAQPVSTAKIANFTAIGTIDGDHATAWRDNARFQFHNCIFMDIGSRIVAFDCFDTDGGWGYGYNGTLDWTNTWNTAYTYSTTVAMPNAGSWVTGAFNDPAMMYKSQNSGNLAEMRGCLVYRSSAADYPGDSKDMAFAGDAPYSQSDSHGYAPSATMGYPVPAFLGTYDAPAGNPALDNVVSTASPIQGLTRKAIFTTSFDGGLDINSVSNINPCAANDALTVAEPETEDDFFVSAPYRGGFSANYNWLEGWTAADAYGMTDTSMNTNAPSVAIASGVVITFQSENGMTYQIERSDNAGGPWEAVTTILGDGSLKTYCDSSMQNAEFYRAVEL